LHPSPARGGGRAAWPCGPKPPHRDRDAWYAADIDIDGLGLALAGPADQDPTAQIEQLKTQLTDLHVQLGDKERGLQEQEQAYFDIRRDYCDIRRECCTLACELEDQEAANDALKDSLAARPAATSRAVESLCAKVHIKLDTFEDTYDEMSPRELSRAF
jgi:hypothetical protein